MSTPYRTTPDAGAFILSWDCEGKWGVADRLNAHHRAYFTGERLRQTYREILDLLADLGLVASFGFVGALTLNPAQYAQYASGFGETPHARCWLRHFEEDAARDQYDGWFVPELLSMVLARRVHEVCSHGFTHLPFDESETSADDAERELRMAVEVARLHRVTPQTFIFPRNIVGHTALLDQHGFLAYRGSLHAGRLGRLAREFHILAASQPHADGLRQSSRQETPVCIPPGEFFNWRYGGRRYVPPRITVARWKSIVRSAVNRRGLVHMWLHPHNLIDGEGEMAILAEVLGHIAAEVRKGTLRNLTQLSYALDLKSASGVDVHAAIEHFV